VTMKTSGYHVDESIGVGQAYSPVMIENLEYAPIAL
jgi:hypothetical protein